MTIGKGLAQGFLSAKDIHEIILQGLDSLDVDGKRVLVIIPDKTRTMPIAMVFSLFEQMLMKRAKNLDYLVALGTHPPLDDRQLSELVGRQVINGAVGNTHIFNHDWQNPDAYTHIGTISAKDMGEISRALLEQDVPIQVNKLIFNYDQIIICGPVFPHEVAGFSGGNKYSKHPCACSH
jgi:nickel-dependent lactate racemase